MREDEEDEDEGDEDKTVGKLLSFISAPLTPGHQPSPRCALDTLILGRFWWKSGAGSAADAARCSPGSSSSDQPSMRHSQLRRLAAVDLLLNKAILPEKLRSTSAPTLLTRLATLASIPQCVALAGSDPTNPASGWCKLGSERVSELWSGAELREFCRLGLLSILVSSAEVSAKPPLIYLCSEEHLDVNSIFQSTVFSRSILAAFVYLTEFIPCRPPQIDLKDQLATHTITPLPNNSVSNIDTLTKSTALTNFSEKFICPRNADQIMSPSTPCGKTSRHLRTVAEQLLIQFH